MPDSVLIQTRVLQLAHELGLVQASKKLGLQRETLCRICAGLPVRPGTLLVAAQALGMNSTPGPAMIASSPVFGEGPAR